jgi:hypothetical protein
VVLLRLPRNVLPVLLLLLLLHAFALAPVVEVHLNVEDADVLIILPPIQQFMILGFQKFRLQTFAAVSAAVDVDASEIGPAGARCGGCAGRPALPLPRLVE